MEMPCHVNNPSRRSVTQKVFCNGKSSFIYTFTIRHYRVTRQTYFDHIFTTPFQSYNIKPISVCDSQILQKPQMQDERYLLRTSFA